MIPLFRVHMPEDLGPLVETLRSGYVAQGPRVDEFERALTALMDTPHVLTLNSGTSALTLAYSLAGVRPSGLVVTTPMTCTATNLPILTAGAYPRFADVDPRTGLIDLEDVRHMVRDTVPDAVVGVDWGGMPCDHEGLREIADEVGIYSIADSAHSLGATVEGRPVGSMAHMTCFSFQAIKHLTTVDGGALAMQRSLVDEYRLGKLLRWFGIDREVVSPGDSRIDVDIVFPGYKMHMNDVAASLGLLQMPHLDGVLQRHRANAMEIVGGLNDQYFEVSAGDDGVVSSWWVLTVLLPNRVARDAFRVHMLSRGVQVSQVHRRNDTYTVFRDYVERELPGLDEFSSRMICLPCHWGLSEEDVATIVAAANDFSVRGL